MQSTTVAPLRQEAMRTRSRLAVAVPFTSSVVESCRYTSRSRAVPLATWRCESRVISTPEKSTVDCRSRLCPSRTTPGGATTSVACENVYEVAPEIVIGPENVMVAVPIIDPASRTASGSESFPSVPYGPAHEVAPSSVCRLVVTVQTFVVETGRTTIVTIAYPTSPAASCTATRARYVPAVAYVCDAVLVVAQGVQGASGGRAVDEGAEAAPSKSQLTWREAWAVS